MKRNALNCLFLKLIVWHLETLLLMRKNFIAINFIRFLLLSMTSFRNTKQKGITEQRERKERRVKLPLLMYTALCI